jgi:hypothetical protein
MTGGFCLAGNRGRQTAKVMMSHCNGYVESEQGLYQMRDGHLLMKMPANTGVARAVIIDLSQGSFFHYAFYDYPIDHSATKCV